MTATWTVAYRKPNANRFQRATNWRGTWEEAQVMAGRMGKLHPELQIWYVTTKAAEDEGAVCDEDRGNILVDSGRRVRIVDNGAVPDELINPQPKHEHAPGTDGVIDDSKGDGFAYSTCVKCYVQICTDDGQVWWIVEQTSDEADCGKYGHEPIEATPDLGRGRLLAKGDMVVFREDFSPALVGMRFVVDSDLLPDNTRGGRLYVWLRDADDPRRTRSGYVDDLRTVDA